MSYNGWKNWETWNVALWCDNDEGIYRERMRQKPRTAKEVEEFVREWFPMGTPDMQNNDRGAHNDPYEAREMTDFEEIAAHWADDYGEEETAE